jgi:hypothetical protein
MRSIRILALLVFLSVLLFAGISCTVQKHNTVSNKQPRAWFKSSNSPNHPKKINPGKIKQQHPKKNKSKHK